MIKTVLFDLGNVLLPYDLMRLASRLASHSPFSPKEILERIGYDKLAHDFETGRMSPEEYFQCVAHSCQLRHLDFDGFVAIFNDIFDEDTLVVDLITRLKKTYKLGLISNTNAIHVLHLKTTYPCLSHFEQLWFSNEAGVRKPDATIYRLALSHFSCEPSETIFIDDLEPNVVAAKSLGIQGLLYQNVKKLEKDLSALGVVH